MRKKIKQLMNKEEGFTLVELLAVIVILGIIVAIAIPSIGSVISKARIGADAAEQELAVDAARLYMLEDPAGAPTSEGATLAIKVSELETAGYLEVPENSNLEDYNEVVVTAKLKDGFVNYTYEFNTGTVPS